MDFFNKENTNFIKELDSIFILDKNAFICRPNPEYIAKKKWYCRIYLEYHDAIESDFIAKAVSSIEKKTIEFIVSQKDNNSNLETSLAGEGMVNLDYVHIFFSKSIDININHAGFTNENIDYLYFKDAENNFFMLFGEKSFVLDSMPVDFNVYKYYYNSFYGNWSSDTIDLLLERLWSEYPKI